MANRLPLREIALLLTITLCLSLTGCFGVNQLQSAPPGLHPENAPTPSGKVLNQGTSAAAN